MKLIYTPCDDGTDIFTIMIKNFEAVKYHYDGYCWRKRDAKIGKWEKVEGNICILQIAKNMAKENNCSLQFVVNTACDEIVSTIL